LAVKPVERKSAAEATILLQGPPLAPGDPFDIGLSAEYSIAIIGLSFLPHDLIVRRDTPAKTAETRFLRLLR
jgi:hypothetical protein